MKASSKDYYFLFPKVFAFNHAYLGSYQIFVQQIIFLLIMVRYKGFPGAVPPILWIVSDVLESLFVNIWTFAG